MPQTTASGFVYPLPGEAPDGPGAIQALAASIENFGPAPLNSPAFTGVPTAPSPTSALDGTAKVATTAWTRARLIQFANMTTAQMNALAGGDLWEGRMVALTDDANGRTWRYNGTKWVPWTGEWTTYGVSLAGVNLGTGGSVTGRYRWKEGRVRTQIWGVHGSGSSFSAGVTATISTAAIKTANSPAGMPILGEFLVYNGTTFYPGKVMLLADGATSVSFQVSVISGSFVPLTTYAANQPLAAAQSTQFWADFEYDAVAWPLS